MGNMESHGHSHDGQPCHGHGGEDHGHSHAASNHGHSHGGQQCNHDHGSGNHGHSHAQPEQAHGHSHGGKPCHGHGHGAPQLPNHVQQRLRIVQLFMSTMLEPKMPVIFGKFHVAANPKPPKGKSSGVEIPDNADEIMTVAEFKAFIRAYLQGIANQEGHGVVRTADVDEMVESFRAKLPAETITQPQFVQLATFVMARTCMSKWEAVPFILAEMGLGNMKLPKIPLAPEVAILEPAAEYCKSEVMPFLSSYIQSYLEEHADSEDINAEVIDCVKRDIAEGLIEADSEHPVVKNWAQSIQNIPANQLAPEFKVDNNDKTIEPKLLAYFVVNTFLTQLFAIDPQAAVPVVKRWGIDLKIAAEESEDDTDKLD